MPDRRAACTAASRKKAQDPEFRAKLREANRSPQHHARSYVTTKLFPRLHSAIRTRECRDMLAVAVLTYGREAVTAALTARLIYRMEDVDEVLAALNAPGGAGL